MRCSRADRSTSSTGVVRADGDERSLELVGTVEHADDSRPLRIVGTVLDVTQRVRARHALERQRAQLAGVIDSALDAIISLDVRLDVVMINPAAERVFGVRAEEMLGRSLARLIPTTARDRLAEQLQTYAAGSVDVPPMIGGRGVTGLHADGHEFPIEFAVSKVTIADEQFLTVILRDITERERDRNALEAQSVRLQRLSLRLLEVQEQEKRHLARELHDELGQLLTATKLRVQQLGATQPAVHELSADLDRALTQVRTMSLDLRPSMLDDLGLVAALRWYVNRQATLGRFEMKFDASGLETRPDPAVETAAFRIVQEALTNVLRHARATKVMVRVWRDDARLRLEVRDDGCGFDPARRSGSSGLLGMRERATLLGGNLTLESAPGRGCTVSADLPFSPTLPGPRETTDG